VAIAPMTSHERMTAVYARRAPDRIPITDTLWESTIERWYGESLSQNIAWETYCGIDRFVDMTLIDTSPRFEPRIIEETSTYLVDQDNWGQVKKNFKPISTTPMHIDARIKDPQSWKAAKSNMTPTSDRVDWETLKKCYSTWRGLGAWLYIAPWFGYDVVSTRMINSEVILYAMVDNPIWVADMVNTGCDLSLALLDMIWDAGYHFDELLWWDDMAYRHGMFFSKKMWRNVLMPYQKRTIDWAHSHGIKAQLHCCGNIIKLIPDLIELGLDALNPMEVKAGMDPVQIKKEYGKDLVLRGGFDIRNWENITIAEEEIRVKLPLMMKGSGYIFSSDHSIPHTISLQNYLEIVNLVKDIGTYRT
jgi:uroporphyrinogen decarboxylase